MNKSIYLLLFTSCLLLIYGCSGDRKNDIEQAKADLEEYIANSENMIDLSNSEFSIKPVEVISNKSFDENDPYNFTDQQTKYLSIDKFLTKVNSDFFIATEFGKPKSLVSISLDILDANKLLGLGDNIEKASFVMPRFKPTVLHFWDGTSADANYNIDKNAEELEYNHFLLDAAKPIRSIDFDVEFKHYISTAYRLDITNPKIKVGDDYLEMKSNGDGEVKLSYPKSLWEKLSEVQGFYKNGKALKNSGSSSYYISSAATIEWLKNTLPIYEKTISLIDEQKLKTAQEVEEYLNGKLPAKPARDVQMEFAKYNSSGPVDHLLVFLKSDKPLNVTEKINVKLLQEMDEIGKEGYFVAVDRTKELKGVVDIKGNWIINPIYDEIRATGEENFSVREGGIGTPRKLDAKNKKFIDLLL